MRRKKSWVHLLKNGAAFGCLALCLWCAGSAVQSWAAAEGTDALFFAAGMRAEAASSPESKEPEVPGISSLEQTRLSEQGEETLFLADDGIVPVFGDELPGATATPDPERASAPVEEIELDGGTQISNFFVRDTTDSGTDLNAELLEAPAVQLKGDGSVEVLIYHTHTSESYSKIIRAFIIRIWKPARKIRK